MKKKQFKDIVATSGFVAAFSLLVKDAEAHGKKGTKDYMQVSEAKQMVKSYLDAGDVKAACAMTNSIAKLSATRDDMYVRVNRDPRGWTVEDVSARNYLANLFDNDPPPPLTDEKFNEAKAAIEGLFNTLKDLGVTLVFDREYDSFSLVSGEVTVVPDREVDQSTVRGIAVPDNGFFHYSSSEGVLAKSE